MDVQELVKNINNQSSVRIRFACFDADIHPLYDANEEYSLFFKGERLGRNGEWTHDTDGHDWIIEHSETQAQIAVLRHEDGPELVLMGIAINMASSAILVFMKWAWKKWKQSRVYELNKYEPSLIMERIERDSEGKTRSVERYERFGPIDDDTSGQYIQEFFVESSGESSIMEDESGSVYVDCLMNRFIYLNGLRVGTATVYLVVVAALIAIVFSKDPSQKVGLGTLSQIGAFSLFTIGLLVYIFDLRCRARASAVAQSIRARVNGLDINIDRGKRAKYLVKGGAKIAELGLRKIDEDFYFSLIVMLVNSLLFSAGVFMLLGSKVVQLSWVISTTVAITVLSAQIIFYLLRWPKLSLSMDEWPDDLVLNSRVGNRGGKCTRQDD